MALQLIGVSDRVVVKNNHYHDRTDVAEGLLFCFKIHHLQVKNYVYVWYVKEERCIGDLAIFLVSPSHAHCGIDCSQNSLRPLHATGAAGLRCERY